MRGLYVQRVLRSLFAIALAIVVCSCASVRKPVPPGTIPTQDNVLSSDEQYGHEVLSGLVEEFPLSKDDQKIDRVRTIIDQLAKAASANNNPWHVYVFDTPQVKNAAATKGNYIFVWSGMVDAVQSDAELAGILAHEIGHVLAGHTQPDPSEEVNSIIASTASQVTSEVISQIGGPWGLAAGLAGALVEEGVKALIVNPDSQQKELEADYIGLFLMAEAGYDPDQALAFWERAEADPQLSGSDLTFLSSHPSSNLRLKELEKYIEEARERYNSKKHPKESSLKKPGKDSAKSSSRSDPSGSGRWVVAKEWVSVFEKPDTKSVVRIDLPHNAELVGEALDRRWVALEKPVPGFVLKNDVQALQ